MANNEYRAALDRYIDKFDDFFPVSLYIMNEKKIIEAIDLCIENGKNAYEMGLVEMDIDI